MPLRVIDGVPYVESIDFQQNCRDHLTDCSSRCGVAVRDGCVVITVKIDSLGAVACPSVSAAVGPASASSSAEGLPAEEPAHTAPGGAKDSVSVHSTDKPCTAEVASDSEDSLGDFESTIAPGTEDELSGYSTDDSVPVRRSLWDVAKSDEHKLSHKPSLPNHCHECMVAKTKRKRRASRKEKRDVKRFGDSVTCDHVFMKDWLGCKGVDGVPDVFNVMDLATRTWYSFPVTSKDALDTFTALNRMKEKPKSSTFILIISHLLGKLSS